MVVVITNLTDGPGKRPREIRIFKTRLLPGKSLKLAAQYVDAKMRSLEEAGHISIGSVPTWYSEHKSKRVLSADEVAASRKRAADVAKKKEEAKKLLNSPAPVQPVVKTVAVEEEVETPEDETETTRVKRRKRR